jgi:hypothetical protein
MKRLANCTLIALVVLLVVADLSIAQVEIAGRIVGTVTDSTGAFIPGVSITVTGPTLFEPRMAVTSEAGTYFVDKLPLGEYKIAFTLPGFKTGVVKSVAYTPVSVVQLPKLQVLALRFSLFESKPCTRMPNPVSNRTPFASSWQSFFVAVGTPITRRPPAQIRTSGTTAYGSYLG